jgi:hypothetical protein
MLCVSAKAPMAKYGHVRDVLLREPLVRWLHGSCGSIIYRRVTQYTLLSGESLQYTRPDEQRTRAFRYDDGRSVVPQCFLCSSRPTFVACNRPNLRVDVLRSFGCVHSSRFIVDILGPPCFPCRAASHLMPARQSEFGVQPFLVDFHAAYAQLALKIALKVLF